MEMNLKLDLLSFGERDIYRLLVYFKKFETETNIKIQEQIINTQARINIIIPEKKLIELFYDQPNNAMVVTDVNSEDREEDVNPEDKEEIGKKNNAI